MVSVASKTSDDFQGELQDAEHVFLMMKGKYRLSRNVRAQWYLNNLNGTVSVEKPYVEGVEQEEELRVVSLLPTPGLNHKLRLTPNTKVTFLSRRYRLVFCLDISPSIAFTDIIKDKIFSRKISAALENCLISLTTPCPIPGSTVFFKPELFVTIIAYIPLWSTPISQVVVQGWKVTRGNLQNLFSVVKTKLLELENVVAGACSQTDEVRSSQRLRSEKLTGVLFDEDRMETPQHTVMASPDINTMDMLRFALLALQLLPDNSTAGLVVVTDGIVSSPIPAMLQVLLAQLRHGTVACHFLVVGSGGAWCPQSSTGLVPYPDLIAFMADATGGAWLDLSSPLDNEKLLPPDYHKSFFWWSFQYQPAFIASQLDSPFEFTNLGSQGQQMTRVRQLKGELSTSLANLLSCRLREGFFLSRVAFNRAGRKDSSDMTIELSLILPIRLHLRIEYKIITAWPPRTQHPSCHYEVAFEGLYELIYDIVVGKEKAKSFYRSAVIKNVWNTVTSLNQTDQLLVHLHSFYQKESYYTIPDKLKAGVPLFCLASAADPRSICLNLGPSPAIDQFAAFWRPVSMLNINIWQKWLHPHRIGVVLVHDDPPKTVHLPNHIGRYSQVQARQAQSDLHSLLRDYAHFVMLENCAYIKLLYPSESDKIPSSFFIIRIHSKPPCLVIQLAFLGGTPGALRNQVVADLEKKLLQLKSTKRGLREGVHQQRSCLQLKKPVEKILVRYEKLPTDYTSIQDDSSTALVTLGRYLIHHRWIWSLQPSPAAEISLDSVARILSTLTRRRVQEGFSFAHSYIGIHNMIKEIDMRFPYINEDEDETFPCVVQFIFFPHHASTCHKDSISEEDDDAEIAETDGELQIITECWIEPQTGCVASHVTPTFLRGLSCHNIPEAFFPIDYEIITTLLTLEHLCLQCLAVEKGAPRPQPPRDPGAPTVQDSISVVPFSPDLLGLLPRSQQAELVFSTLLQDVYHEANQENCPNEVFFKHMLEALEQAHHMEIDLTVEENIKLMSQIVERPRNGHLHPLPFQEQVREEMAESHWKCLAKAISPTHLILTFLPASYSHLKKLILDSRHSLLTLHTSSLRYANTRGEEKSALPLPLYCYECILSQVVLQLVHRTEVKTGADIFQDLTFKLENEPPLSASPYHVPGLPPPPQSPDTTQSDDSESTTASSSDRIQLRKHCRLIEAFYNRSFVYTIFTCLQLGIPVDGQDVEAAIDNMCEEYFLELDITCFLQMVCHDLKDVLMSTGPKEEVALGPLLSSPKCPAKASAHHSAIKSRFLQILQQVFQPVPSQPSNRYFFCPPHYGDLADDEEYDDTTVPLDARDVMADIEGVSDEGACTGGGQVEGSDMEGTFAADEDLATLSSLIQEDDKPSAGEPPTPPLFLQLVCSVRKGSLDSDPRIDSLPTCIAELSPYLGNCDSTLAFKDLKVTLDFVCLSLPPDVERPTLPPSRERPSTSVCSTVSPVPDQEPSLDSFLPIGFPPDTIADRLEHLPDFQHQMVHACIDKIKWLLQDEICSSALSLRPLSESTLDMVADHVASSPPSPCCRRKEVPLQFVLNNALDIFTQEFEQLSLPGHCLHKLGKFYILVRDCTPPQAVIPFPGSDTEEETNTLTEPASGSTAGDSGRVKKRRTSKRLKPKESSPKSPSLSTGFPQFLKAQTMELSGLEPQSPASQMSDSPFHLPTLEADAACCSGSGQESTNEEDGAGYEGDTDDTGGSDWDVSPADTIRLPPFWLLFQVLDSKVDLFFHLRDRDGMEEEVLKAKNVLLQSIAIIKAICKTVNQTLLLHKLHETRICNQLLVPEASEDIWKTDIVRFAGNNEDYEQQTTGDYLEATLSFNPGTFACNCVWQTFFPLHPRLVATPGRSSMSLGLKTLRSVLDTFAVSNRKNMFVYQDHNTGSVFYLRLYECHLPTESGYKLDEASSLTGSCHSTGALGSRNGDEDSIQSQEFRGRLSSNLSDKDSDTTPSILLQVHGIGEVGSDISEELVKTLQNKLDDAVLETILVMFSRNPHCKLKPDDVHFIQKPGKEPSRTLHFSVQIPTLPLLPALAVYVRQNLLSFLYIPKYLDTRPANHFKAYGACQTRDDDDVFLYYKPQALGTSGSKGLACIIFSVVDGQGQPCRFLTCQLPAPQAWRNGLQPYEYEELTHTVLVDASSSYPGPLALLQFQLWYVGRVNENLLTEQLQRAVRHALWDVVLEFRLLTAPLVLSLPLPPPLPSYSEPSTPTRTVGVNRRPGSKVDHPDNFQSLLSRELSSSVPHDIGVLTPQQAGSELGTPAFHDTAPPRASPESNQEDHSGILMPILQEPLQNFFDYGLKDLSYLGLSKHTLGLTSRFSLPFIMQEFQKMVHSLCPDLAVRIFFRPEGSGSDYSAVNMTLTPADQNPAFMDCKPGQCKQFVVTGRNVMQWKAFMGHKDAADLLDTFLQPPRNQKSQQKHLPVLLRCSESRYQDSTPPSPIGPRTASALPSPLSPMPGSRVSTTSYGDNRTGNFVPRQIFFIMYASEKQIVLYLYNWSDDARTELLRGCQKLVQWNNARALLLRTLFSHKLGVFHNNPLARRSSSTKVQGKEPGPPATRGQLEMLISIPWPSGSSSQLTHGAPANQPVVLKDLLKNSAPTRAMHHSPRPAGAHDPVVRHGTQALQVLSRQRRDLQDLYKIWQSRSTSLNVPYVDRTLQRVKSVARLSHYCLTPLLFSPVWRSKLAPVRDHTLEAPSYTPPGPLSDLGGSRSRHSSASSASKQEVFRKVLGGSKLLRHPTDSWSQDICANYMLDILSYLQSLGFVAVQTSSTKHRSGGVGGASRMEEELVGGASVSGTHSLPYPRGSSPTYFLVKLCLGGLLVLEVGFMEPYAYTLLYSLEGPRLETSATSSLHKSSHFITNFVDEVAKIKSSIHMHSFTYDYHLRSISNYLSGRQLMFRQGYHLTSFLDDFLNYYQKSPSYSGNIIYSDIIVKEKVPMPPNHLFNYIISNNTRYGMSVMRMEPIFLEKTGEEPLDTDYVVVELSNRKVAYKDVMSDQQQLHNFGVGLLVSQVIPDAPDSLALRYYILLTSKSELYPTPLAPSDHGSFRPVRLPAQQISSGRSSRKISTSSSNPLLESGDSTGSTSRMSSVPEQCPQLCDEDVVYLGYFSSQETVLQKVLADEELAARRHLEDVIDLTVLNCRRDHLWGHLVPLAHSAGAAPRASNMGFAEFTELLNLTTVVPLTKTDPALSPFLNMSPSWYTGLARELSQKFLDCHHTYSSPDGQLIHTVVAQAECPSCFVMLSFDLMNKPSVIREPYFDHKFSLVFRDPATDLTRLPNHQAVLRLVEDIVNYCCYHLWTGLVAC